MQLKSQSLGGAADFFLLHFAGKDSRQISEEAYRARHRVVLGPVLVLRVVLLPLTSAET